MKSRRPGVWIACLSVALVAIAGVADVRRAAPGPLSAVHAADPALAEMVDCAACHGGLLGSLADSCLECHGLIDDQVAEASGLHGTLPQGEARRCANCHSEHHGSSFSIVNQQSYTRMGIQDPEAFNHVLVGFAMDGAHLEQDCIKCHEHARDEVLPRGATRFLGLSQDCASCHDDPHEGRMVLDCAQCHGQERFEDFDSLGHERFLPLLGAHEAAECGECHAPESPQALESLGMQVDREAARECADCHESPHAANAMESVAQHSAPAFPRPMRAGSSCAVCHEAEHTSFRDDRLDLRPDLHAQLGFSLDQPHDELSCAECHGESGGAFSERFPGRESQDCAACHEDPHAGQFQKGPFAEQGCVACHGPTEFEPHAFGAEQHAQAFLPLDGSHAEIACEACHEQPYRDAARVFRGTPNRCESCHEDAHDGAFDAVAQRLPRQREGLCSRCHDSGRFDKLAEPFEHAQWTGFELTGAHVQEACDVCHLPADEADEQGRRFGHVSDQFGFVEGCNSCHADPHEGRFDGPLVPSRVSGQAECARCHDTTSFRSLVDPFDHRLWTGFPLNGTHGSSDCSSCHAPVRPLFLAAGQDGIGSAARDGRTWERALGTDCSSCHEDSHAGQFAQRGATDCAACHRDSESFSDLRFSHESDSRFSLGEAHRQLECAACHEPVRRGGQEIVLYTPLPTECVDCHGVHESVLLRRAGLQR